MPEPELVLPLVPVELPVELPLELPVSLPVDELPVLLVPVPVEPVLPLLEPLAPVLLVPDPLVLELLPVELPVELPEFELVVELVPLSLELASALVEFALLVSVDAVSEMSCEADVATVPAPQVWLETEDDVGSYTVTEPSPFTPITSAQCSLSVRVCALSFTATNAPFSSALVSSVVTEL